MALISLNGYLDRYESIWTKFQLKWTMFDANRYILTTLNNQQQSTTTISDDDPRRSEILKVTRALAWAQGRPSAPTYLYEEHV